jgi:LysR family transcriptional regulator, glycine cleavage system transcriptional activator
MQMAADAAIRGLGVALGRRPLLDDDIDSGRLIPLFDQSIPSGSGYWLVTAQTDFQKPEVKLFKRWMLSEFGRAAEHKPARSPARSAQGVGASASATRSKRRSPRA